MKIIFTIAVVFAVWHAFKYFSNLQDQREKRAKVQKRAQESAPQSGVEDMVECKVCGAYVARGAKSCGRNDCPF